MCFPVSFLNPVTRKSAVHHLLMLESCVHALTFACVYLVISGPGEPAVTPRNARFYRALFNDQMALHGEGYDTPMLCVFPCCVSGFYSFANWPFCVIRLTPWGGDFVSLSLYAHAAASMCSH